MFENVLYQDRLVANLTDQIRARRFPASSLFEGNRYTGKMTAAIEVARALTCKNESAEWSCQCRSCKDQRALLHPSTKYLGNRDFMTEIAACYDVTKRVDSVATRFLFIRSVRKLTRRFDPDLWDSGDKRYKSAAGISGQIEETLIDLSTDPNDTEASSFVDSSAQIVELCEKLTASTFAGSIPVDQIRRLSSWAHTTSGESAKVAILDSVENMGHSSSNALLKILEEPPKDTYFVLVTTSREALLPTIRSRVRRYHFPDRKTSEEKEILQRIFRETGDEYSSIDDYFLAWRLSPEVIRNQSRRFLRAVLEDAPSDFFDKDQNRDLQTIIKDNRLFTSFLSEVIGACCSLVHDGNTDIIVRAARWKSLFNSTYSKMSRFNMKPETLLESLFYRMRETI